MVNVFGDSIASGPEGGNLQKVKRVVASVGQFNDYYAEIQQRYVLGFTPYRLHTNSDGTFVTPIRVYDGRVYVLDDETTMNVTTRHIATDRISSKLVFFVKGDDDGGVGFALHGCRGPSGAKGLKGDSGDRGVAGCRGPIGKRGAAGPGGPPGNIGKVGPVGARGEARARGDRVTRETMVVLVNKSLWVNKEVRANRIVEEPLVQLDPNGIDIVAELCKHLPVEMVEQYRRGAYIRYAINSMKDRATRCCSRQDYY